MERTGKGLRLMLIGVLILTMISSACNAGKNKGDPPKFFVHHTTVNVGEIYEGKDINYVFDVRNNGNGELHIISVKPG